jgi:adenine-specific DNA-methyltransferase
MSTYDGRLELTWTNKHLRLLAHEDGSYEWVPPSDYRVAEVRLFHDITTVGDVGKSRAADNLLIRGDALNALTSLARLPEFANEYLGKVKLVYIDPPFNTQQSFLQYDDALEHSVWLTMMRDRLLQVRDLLARNGSVWVHCDDSEQHRLRCVLDEVFGPSCFVATIVWQKRYSRENRPAIGTAHDYIIVYAPDPGRWKQERNLLPPDERTKRQYRNPNNDPRGPWRAIPMNAMGYRPNQMYDIVAPSGKIKRPPDGSCWKYVRTTYDDLVAQGRIYFGKDGDAQPSIVRYLDEVEGLVPWTWWTHEEVGHTDEAKREVQTLFPGIEAFGTPKPERLLDRIIEIGSSPGDVVVDPFVGSGTTAAVAHKKGRRWVAIEREATTIDTYAQPRLSRVVAGDDPGGVTELTSWSGGGGFHVFDVAPSMFEVDSGMVFLADWMTNGALAEATAAQLGFTYESDPPFSGRKGRSRLAVVDGVVNESVVRLLVSALPDRERVVVCGTGIDTDARPILRELRPGSTLRKIPAALLDEYRSARQLRLGFAEEGGPETPNRRTAQMEAKV